MFSRTFGLPFPFNLSFCFLVLCLGPNLSLPRRFVCFRSQCGVSSSLIGLCRSAEGEFSEGFPSERKETRPSQASHSISNPNFCRSLVCFTFTYPLQFDPLRLSLRYVLFSFFFIVCLYNSCIQLIVHPSFVAVVVSYSKLVSFQTCLTPSFHAAFFPHLSVCYDDVSSTSSCLSSQPMYQ